MAKIKTSYVCTECGFRSVKWNGRCPGCSQWNTMVEEISSPTKKNSANSSKKALLPTKITEIDTTGEERYLTGMKEFDRVLGGGIVKGSIVLLGGDPGIGKSTILLQVCQTLCNKLKILYISGEESLRQLKLRANRLKVDSDNLLILTQTDIECIVETIKVQSPDLVIVDSIQTMNFSELTSSPGSITQVRECTNILMRCAKTVDIPIIIVSHVNKDGAIAGPKVLEHIVDAVLYFEGNRQLPYRILRAIKNRYGSTNEIGVFEMSSYGLDEVENPSMALLSGRPKNVSGTCVACAMEGSRPILSEIQALATPSVFKLPRRTATGFDYNRLYLILAVLEKRVGMFFSTSDVYVNVIGGLKLDEPAVDLAVACALVSSLKDIQLVEDRVAFGEIGLGGEIRSVPNALMRVKEASMLGFKKCIIPYYNFKKLTDCNNDLGIEIVGVKDIRSAIIGLTQ